MLESLLWIVLLGYFAGQLVRRLQGPPLVGMILAGLFLGPQGSQLLDTSILAVADDLRAIAVMIILVKAGLGLDRDKLVQQGTVALRLGFLPAACEAGVVAIAAHFLFRFDWPTGLMLGCILGAESPAVIVPGMLRLKSLGWGVKKGIPDAILTGSALSDVLMLLVFSLLLSILSNQAAVGLSLPGGLSLSVVQLLPLQVVAQIGFGLLLGAVSAWGLTGLLTRQRWTQTAVQDTLITAGLALWLVVVATQVPLFSGYLAVMALGFFIVERDAPLARRLRQGFNALWTVAEIVLFVLLGASLQLSVLDQVLWPGLLLLAMGTLVGRSLGWVLSTWGSNWTWQERLFLLPGNSAKATVQAAIGALPLAAGIPGGDIMLAIAALSILVTAPLGAWGIPALAPKLLQKGTVDPTKGAIARPIVVLAAVDTSAIAASVLVQAAALARRSDGEVIVLHVQQPEPPEAVATLKAIAAQHLADIRHRFVVVAGAIPETIVQVAQDLTVSEIVIGKRGHQSWQTVLMGSVSQTVLEMSPIPVLVVAGGVTQLDFIQPNSTAE